MSDLGQDLERLAPEVDSESAWQNIQTRLPVVRRQRMSLRASLAGVAFVALVAIGVVTLPDQGPPVADTTPPPVSSVETTTTSTPPTSTPLTGSEAISYDFEGPPSQSMEEAEGDGVVAELAQIPLAVRAEPLLEVETPEGSWVVAQPTQELIDASMDEGCLLGDPVLFSTALCTMEYGEILLLAGDSVVKAYPFPGVPPTWILVVPEAIYAGRRGDGGLPDSTLVKIDRTTLEADVRIFPSDPANPPEVLDGWQVVDTKAYSDLVGVVEGTGTKSWTGELRVDLNGIREFFTPGALVDPTSLVTVEQVERCGIECFEVTYRSASQSDSTTPVYPPDLDFEKTNTLVVDCSANSARPVSVSSSPLIGPGPYDAYAECDALLGMADLAAISPYFHLTSKPDAIELTQIGGPWISINGMFGGCWGAPTDPPACDIGHEAGDWFYMTAESVTVEGSSVVVAGTEWDVRYVDAAFDVRGEVGPRQVELECGSPVSIVGVLPGGQVPPGTDREDWTRFVDACYLAAMYRDGDRAMGMFRVVLDETGKPTAMAEQPELAAP